MRKKPLFSIIIPIRTETAYLKETILNLKKQTLNNYEVLVITDKIANKSDYSINHVGPSFKRNLGAKMAKGRYLAFLDDDSYPDPDWLKNADKVFSQNHNGAAVCGPCLTPPHDNIFRQASGLVWSSWLGSGGAGVYRNSIKPQRLVDDFPSVNLIVQKSDFWKIGGFDNKYWPGEDTLLCLNLTKKLNKTIIYNPGIIVYHHRRNVIIPHLQQITRYALCRGYFAKKFPQTSFRLGYLLPSFLSLYLIFLIPANIFTFHFLNLLNLPLYFYLSLLLYTFFSFWFKNSFLISLLAVITIPITHLYYGILFIKGYFSQGYKFKPHSVDFKTGQYIGG